MSNATQSLAGTRITSLLDANSFVEIGQSVTARNTDFNMTEKKAPSDGVITGYGVIDGNLVYVYSQDVSVLNGTVGEMHAKKITRLYDMAMNKFDEIEWIRIIKSVYLRKQDCRLSPWEENYGATAKEFFHGEISILLNIPYENVEQYITQAVSSDSW